MFEMLKKPVSGIPASPLMLSALQGKKTTRTPFWLMRQAGRYLPEYRELRKQAGSFLDLCFNPKLATEVTLQPLRRFDMDAAILFSDILVIPFALGQSLAFEAGEGPKLGDLDISSIEKNLPGGLEKLSPVLETVSRTRQALDPGKVLIGFAGSPWTVACYMIEGQGSRQGFPKMRQFILENPEKHSKLMDCLIRATIDYLSAQIKAGADAVQLFDSWAGLCQDHDFETNIIEPTRHIVRELKKRHPHTPIIGFPRQAGSGYAAYARLTGVNALGLDTHVSLEQAAVLQKEITVQGNLDPDILLRGGDELQHAAKSILAALTGRPFIFNLGHGIIKETPPEHVAMLADIIKGWHHAG